jgi:thioredoxin 1
MKNLSYEEFKIVVSSKTPVLIEFWSPACFACDKAESYLLKLENAYKNKINIAKININDFVDLIEMYSVSKLPTFILFKETKELMRVVGFGNGDLLEREIRKCF